MSAIADPIIAAMSSIELISSRSFAGGEHDAAQESAVEVVSAKGLVSVSKKGLTSSKSGGSASAAQVEELTTSWSAPYPLWVG